MPYAEGRTYYDADSHIMELPDWLGGYVGRRDAGPHRPAPAGRAPGAWPRPAVAAGRRPRRDDEAARAELEAGLLDAKGWNALGAFDPAERSRALDLLGFDRQLVFPTFASSQFIGQRRPRGAGRRQPGAQPGHRRLLLARRAAAGRGLRAAGRPRAGGRPRSRRSLADGAAAIQVSHDAPPRRPTPTPTTTACGAAWPRPASPSCSTWAAPGSTCRRSLHDNGLAPVTDFLGGGENIRSKDYIALSHAPELFLACMAMDGVFERFPGLRGAAIELGAAWVPTLLVKLDQVTRNFRKSEPQLNAMPLSPREYVERHVWFTPFPGEPVGDIIDQCGEDLLMFSSDYPHPEGTRDPLGRFEATMDGVSDAARERFYSGNFADLMGLAPA